MRVALRPTESDRRSGSDRRSAERRVGLRRASDWVALPPLSRLVPALLVVALSVLDLAVAQETGAYGWSFLVVVAAFPIAAYSLATSGRWVSRPAVVWLLVVLYVLAATAHITWMVMR